MNNDEILLCRISSQLPRWEGLWTFPGGGIEFGEDPECAVVREVKEETGLDVEPLSVALVDSIVERRDEEDFEGIRIIYNVRILGGSLRHEKSGTTDLCQWHHFSIEIDRIVDLVEVGLNHVKEIQRKDEPNMALL